MQTHRYSFIQVLVHAHFKSQTAWKRQPGRKHLAYLEIREIIQKSDLVIQIQAVRKRDRGGGGASQTGTTRNTQKPTVCFLQEVGQLSGME